MCFFFRNVESDPSCTTQVLLDGRYVSVDTLSVKRCSSLVEVFPCQSPCCAGPYPADLVYKVPPLKLAIRVTKTPEGHCISFSLSRKAHILKDLTDFIFSSAGAERLYSIDVHVAKHTGTIQLSVHLMKRHIRSFTFADSLSEHSDEQMAFYLAPSDHVSSPPSPPSPTSPTSPRSASSPPPSPPPLPAAPRRPTDRWGCIELFRSRDREISPHGIFDDRAPTADRNGNVFWKGFEEALHHVVLRAVTFWSASGVLAGVQASYEVDGRLHTGPRHLSVPPTASALALGVATSRPGSSHSALTEDSFRLQHGEDIAQLGLVLRSSGLCSHIVMRTTTGRQFTAGSQNPAGGGGKEETVYLAPHTRIVAFRGAAEQDGLRNFGIVIEKEADKGTNVAVRADLTTCMVCGASRSYFKDDDDFRSHLEHCKAIQAPGTKLCVQPPAL